MLQRTSLGIAVTIASCTLLVLDLVEDQQRFVLADQSTVSGVSTIRLQASTSTLPLALISIAQLNVDLFLFL